MVLRISDWYIKRDRVVTGTCGEGGVFIVFLHNKVIKGPREKNGSSLFLVCNACNKRITKMGADVPIPQKYDERRRPRRDAPAAV
jgi:hypothetical protein